MQNHKLYKFNTGEHKTCSRVLDDRMTESIPPASAISEWALKETGQAMLNGDFDAFCACFHLPHTVATFEGERTIETREAFADTFMKVHRHYRQLGVTELVRHCINAEYKDEDTVEATHEARVINGRELLQEPFPGFTILRRIDGKWGIVHSAYAIADSPRLNRAIMDPNT